LTRWVISPNLIFLFKLNRTQIFEDMHR